MHQTFFGRAGEYIDDVDWCNSHQQNQVIVCTYHMHICTCMDATKTIHCQTPCRSRLRDLRRDTNCEIAYEHCCSH